jgi:hypothetical protein
MKLDKILEIQDPERSFQAFSSIETRALLK